MRVAEIDKILVDLAYIHARLTDASRAADAAMFSQHANAINAVLLAVKKSIDYYQKELEKD